MTSRENILFIQRRPTRAGAQTSLSRLIAISPKPTLTLCAEEGWLTETLEESIVRKWPSPRSLPARLGGLKRFASKLTKELQGISIVVANDHHECPVAKAIATALSVPCVALLRTPGMSQHDFEKYHCGEFDHVFVVGQELHDKVLQWTSIPPSTFTEGFLETEFIPPPPARASCPDTILVAGSEEPRKGFQDFIAALEIIQNQQPDFCLKKVVFTGRPPEESLTHLKFELEFVGRVEDFIPFARQFDFAVHPSRHETFGLAPLELIISGVPTLCSKTGCADESLLPSSWLVPPSSPEAIATALLDWQNHWSSRNALLPEVSRNIHQRFAIAETSKEFFKTIQALSSAS